MALALFVCVTVISPTDDDDDDGDDELLTWRDLSWLSKAVAHHWSVVCSFLPIPLCQFAVCRCHHLFTSAGRGEW